MAFRRLPLAGLGQIRGGYVLPSRKIIRGASGGGPRYLALQASDIAPDGTIVWGALSRVTPRFDATRYRIREGDVLIPLRSARPSAVVARDVPPDVIAMGHWAIVSPEPTVADPDYLVWYVNHPATAARLNGLMRGTSLRFLSITALRDFEVELPPLDLQRRIARVHALAERVTDLERQLAAAREQLIHSLTHAALRRAVQRERNE